ncbi:MAG: ATP-binding protein [Acidimicrobiia bacterium]|nr:ATP-binding protein [Acidimicrobiia bacterium]MDH5294762.1 ATP-binding protein [Acidimicrobiia bacterium]
MRRSPAVRAVIGFLALAGLSRLALGETLVGFAPEAGWAVALVAIHRGRGRSLAAWFAITAGVVAGLGGASFRETFATIVGTGFELTIAAGLFRMFVDPLVRPDSASWWAKWAGSSVAGALVGAGAFALLTASGFIPAWLSGHGAGLVIVAPGVWVGIRWARSGGWHHRWDVASLVRAVFVAGVSCAVGAALGLGLGRPEPYVIPVLALGWLATTVGHRVTVMASTVIATAALYAVTAWSGAGSPPLALTLAVVLVHAAAAGLAIEASARWHADALLAGVVGILRDAILIVDSDGMVMTASPTAERLFGRAVPDLDLRRLIPDLPHDWAGSSPRVVTTDALHSDGTLLPIEVTVGAIRTPGRPTWAIVCRDLTETTATAAALRRSAEIIDASPDLVGWTDPEGRLLFLNHAGRAMIGAGDDETLGPWAGAGLLSGDAVRVAAEEGSWRGETVLAMEDGVHLPLRQTVVAHRSDAGEVRYFSIVASDISERYELEAMKGEFIENVTHELRSPLTAVIGYLELVRSKAFGEIAGQVDEVLGEVEGAAGQLLEMVNDLLDLWRAEGRGAADPENLDVLAVVESAAHVMRPVAAGKRIALEVGGSSATTVGDRRQLERALLNVISNAVKFTPVGGRVTASVSVDGGVATIRVSDTGVGIPPSEVEAVFDRFYRASTAHEADIPGTGLGLPLVRQVFRGHGGEARIESQVGIGTTVVCTLPTIVLAGSLAPA